MGALGLDVAEPAMKLVEAPAAQEQEPKAPVPSAEEQPNHASLPASEEQPNQA